MRPLLTRNPTRPWPLLHLGVFGLTIACSGADDATGEPEGPTREDPAGACDDSTTGFAGDCLAPDAPAPEDGFQLHYGPDDYDDPDDVARFVLEAGGEVNDCQYRRTPNESEVFFGRYEARMRPGTHHLILFGTDRELELGQVEACAEGVGLASGQVQWIFAGQSGLGAEGGRLDYPGADVPPENEGLAFRLAARKYISYNMHYVNTSDEPLLRESWANVWYSPESDVGQVAEPIVFIGGVGMNIPPATTEVVPATCDVPEGVDGIRVVDVWPHMHAHGERFTAFKVDASGVRTRIYESYDWEEPLGAAFDTLVVNPEPDAATSQDGATSGVLELAPGEGIAYECEITNDLDQPLVFANEAYTAEMCNLFGTHTSPSMSASWVCFN